MRRRWLAIVRLRRFFTIPYGLCRASHKKVKVMTKLEAIASRLEAVVSRLGGRAAFKEVLSV